MKLDADTTFKQFVMENWTQLVIPVCGPILIFTVAYFVSNIGWRAIPMALLIAALSGGLTLLGLYNRWYAVQKIMKDIRAAGLKIKSLHAKYDK